MRSAAVQRFPVMPARLLMSGLTFSRMYLLRLFTLGAPYYKPPAKKEMAATPSGSPNRRG